MTDFLLQPWPWWFSGPLIGLTVPLLYLLAGKGFGISTSFQQIGALCSPRSKLDYLKNYDRRQGTWTLVFALGIVIGGFIGSQWLSAEPIEFLPAKFYSIGGAIKLFIGGTLVGFGARYAGGLHLRPRNYRNCELEFSQCRRHHFLFRWRPRRHLGLGDTFFSKVI